MLEGRREDMRSIPFPFPFHLPATLPEQIYTPFSHSCRFLLFLSSGHLTWNFCFTVLWPVNDRCQWCFINKTYHSCMGLIDSAIIILARYSCFLGGSDHTNIEKSAANKSSDTKREREIAWLDSCLTHVIINNEALLMKYICIKHETLLFSSWNEMKEKIGEHVLHLSGTSWTFRDCSFFHL